MSDKLEHCDYVYHCSPDSDIGKLRPTGMHKGIQALPMQQGGIYVAPKFRDALAWYCSFVRHKKNSSNTLPAKEREKKGEKEIKYAPPHDKLYYHGATIYKIAVPKGFLKGLWGADMWEPEYFIPSEKMKRVQIFSAKTYSDGDLMDLYSRSRQKAWESRQGSWDTESMARDLRQNPAAVMYIYFLEAFRKMALSRKTDRVRKNIWNLRCRAFKNLMTQLEKYFLIHKYSSPSIPVPRCTDIPGMHKVASRIRLLLNTPDENFKDSDWSREIYGSIR